LFSVPDWTAEDYALMGGHQDIAAELKSQSERMVMSFTEKSVESQRCDAGIAPSKRSVSDASLPPDQQEHEKEVRASSLFCEISDYRTLWYKTFLGKLIVQVVVFWVVTL
jgi:hypothetical protein